MMQRTNAWLGTISARQFMQAYWHKKPCLLRQAIPLEDLATFTPAFLAQLAAQDEVESRLIQKRQQTIAHAPTWSLVHGPLRRLPSSRTPRWTVLVQGVNLHDDAAARLLERFRFVPQARLDDVMMSY